MATIELLWDSKCPEYTNKQLRDDALRKWNLYNDLLFFIVKSFISKNAVVKLGNSHARSRVNFKLN